MKSPGLQLAFTLERLGLLEVPPMEIPASAKTSSPLSAVPDTENLRQAITMQLGVRKVEGVLCIVNENISQRHHNPFQILLMNDLCHQAFDEELVNLKPERRIERKESLKENHTDRLNLYPTLLCRSMLPDIAVKENVWLPGLDVIDHEDHG